MCLAVFAWQQHPRYTLILAANRDEYTVRPTAPAGFWSTAPHVFGGRDLQAGGTWLGITQDGRLGWITNYRNPQQNNPAAPSRGQLVADYLNPSTGIISPRNYLDALSTTAHRYNGFNLVLGNPRELVYYTNKTEHGNTGQNAGRNTDRSTVRNTDRKRTQNSAMTSLASGIYGLSNARLNTPWPKVQRARRHLQAAVAENLTSAASLATEACLIQSLFTLLADQFVPSDETLPDTGVGLNLERFLAPVFIAGQDYATRCATVVLITIQGRLTFAERTFVPGGDPRTDFTEIGLHKKLPQ